MDILSPYFLLSLSFLLVVIHLLRRKPNLPPSPWAIPVIGHLYLIKDSFYLSFTSLTYRYGPIFYLKLGCKSFVMVSSPSLIEECFTKNDITLANRPKSMSGDYFLYNYTEYAFAPYGHYWRVMRRLTVAEMFSPRRLQLSTAMREEEMSMFARALGRACDRNWTKVDFKYLSSSYNLNHVMRLLFGKRFVDEEDVWGKVGKENVSRFKEIFFGSVLSGGMCDYFPLLRLIGYKGLEKQMKLVADMREKFFNEWMDEVKARKVISGNSLLETLLSHQASDPEFYTDDVVKSTVSLMITAGTETAAATLEWAMTHLLINTNSLHKLRQEIDANIGHTRIISDSDLANLPYLQSVFNETLRLHPPTPFLLPHYTSEECTIGGYTIPKDTTLLVNTLVVHKDTKLWDDPLEFKPERFMGTNLDKEVYQFLPFGLGRRSCPGAGLATRAVLQALGTYIQCFEWEKVTGEEIDMEVDYGYTVLQKLKPLEAMCKPRDKATHFLSQL